MSSFTEIANQGGVLPEANMITTGDQYFRWQMEHGGGESLLSDNGAPSATPSGVSPASRLNAFYESFASSPFNPGDWTAKDIAFYVAVAGGLFFAYRFLRRRSGQGQPRSFSGFT